MGRVDERKVRESANKLRQMPEGVQYAVLKVLPNILEGVCWSFVDMREVMAHVDVIKNTPELNARKIKDACLIEADPAFVFKAIQAIDPTAITKKDLETYQERRFDGYLNLEKWLIHKGKTVKNFGGTIGIYSLNDTPIVTFKGTNYPAFKVSAEQALQLLNEYGYQIRVNGQWCNVADIANGNMQAFWSELKIAPTKRCVFFDVRCAITQEQMKEKERNYKAKYGKAMRKAAK